jgi:ribosomal-protein-alanine N-acetyltransferase
MFPEIETERLLLRMYRTDDAEAIHRIWTDSDVTRYIDPNFKPTLEQTREIVIRMIQRWRERHVGQWVVCLKEDGKLIGYCGFKPLNGVGPETEIVYGLSKEHWNKGYATELTKACLRYVFENTELDYILAIAFPENVGSWRVMEKAGMKFEKNTQVFDHDMVLYSISKENFRATDASYKLSFINDDEHL